MYRLCVFLCLSFSFFLKTLSAAEWANHRSYVGPQVYHLERTKATGTKQKGWLYGLYGFYERRPDNGFYGFVEGYWNCGTLKGKTSKGSVLKSWSDEYKLDGRLGYSFCKKNWKRLSFVPYVGYGGLTSTNDFKKPSPLLCHYTDHFDYASAGAEILFFPYVHTELGISVEVDFMRKGTSKVKRDPVYGKHTLKMDDRNQYEVDLWYRRHWSYKEKTGWFIISPFYQYRHYGGKAAARFDFIDTEFDIYGLRFLANICF